MAISWADKPYSGQRALLAAGTATYDSSVFQHLDKVQDSLQLVVGAFRQLGFVAVAEPPGYRLDPSLSNLRSAVREAAAAAPVVVVYYTGHGVAPDRETYYLITKDSQLADLSESALPARDLPTLFTLRDDQGQLLTDQPTVLLILDCCYSASAGMNVLEDALRGIGNPKTWIIASAGPLDYAQQGLFAKAFRQVLERPTIGPSQPCVDPLTIVDAVNNAGDGHGRQQAWLFLPAGRAARIPPFFPNPGYQAGLAGMTVADQQHWLSRVRGGPEESTTGFYLTGKTGRIRAAEDLVKWIRDPGRHGLALVTGSPGTGKSALLALPTLLTTRSWREDLLGAATPESLIARAGRLLPAETRVIAVHARGLNTEQAAGAIAHALGRHANTASGLLEALDISPQRDKQVVLVDAVDEAISPGTLLGGLLIPLSRQPGLRIVAGARRHVLPDSVAADMIIDLDAGPYRDPEALTDYVHRLLTAAEEPGLTTPYQACIADRNDTQAEATAEVAAAIARQATARDGGPESFLIGRLLALSARSRAEPVDVTSEGWQTELPASVAEAFDEDLARLGDKQPLARILLGALAWAKGPGLPWENIWGAVARAMAAYLDPARLPISDDDIRWLLSKAGAYVVEDLGSGERSVYRPFHDLLARHLRGEPALEAASASDVAAWQRRRVGIEETITSALLATVPVNDSGQLDWLYTHPYLRTYLAQHAAAAGSASLAALIQDMDFLSVADPVTLTTLVSPAIPETRELARTYRRARPLLGDDPAANAAYLREAARALATSDPNVRKVSLRKARRALVGSTLTSPPVIPPLYRTHLAAVRRDDSLLTLTGHVGSVLGVAFGSGGDGSLRLAAADEGGIVRLWDPLTGAPVGGPLVTGADGVSSAAFGIDRDGRLLVASGGSRGTVRLWDALTGARLGKRLASHIGGVSSVALGIDRDGRLLLASGGSRGTVRLWDALTGVPVGGPLATGGGGVSSVAFGTDRDGRLLLASGGSDETVRLWDPLTGTHLGERPILHAGGVSSVAFGTDRDGRLLLVSGGPRGTLRLWDPLTGHQLEKPLTGHTGWVHSVAFGIGPGRQLLLASGDSDGTVRLWDPAVGTRTDQPVAAHTNSVYSVALGTDNGRLVLASGGDDGKVRLWDVLSGASIGVPLTGHNGHVLSVALWSTHRTGRVESADPGRVSAAPLLASGGSDGTVRLWTPPTGGQRGGPFGAPLKGDTGRVLCVAFGLGPDEQLLLASGGSDGTVRLWDPFGGRDRLYGSDPEADREWLFTPVTAHAGAVFSVAFGGGPDNRIIASAGEDGTMRVWPLTHRWMRKPLTVRTGPVLSIAFGALGGFLLLASGASDGTVQLWNPATGSKFGRPLTGHTGRVRSVAFVADPDSRGLLASGGEDQTVRLWDLTTGSVAAVLHRRSSVYSVVATGTMLAIGDAEGVSVIELAKLPTLIG